MKNMRPYLITLTPVISIIFCQQSFGAQLSNLSHEQVLATVEGFMYVHELSQKCPFSKEVADSLELVAMATIPSLPKISNLEQTEAANRARSRATRDIASSKERACNSAQQVVQDSASRLSKSK